VETMTHIEAAGVRGSMAQLRVEEGEPWGTGVKLLCFRWLSPFHKLVQKGFPGEISCSLWAG
jgi:hypothetical protein